jgi:hypothetical protein
VETAIAEPEWSDYLVVHAALVAWAGADPHARAAVRLAAIAKALAPDSLVQVEAAVHRPDVHRVRAALARLSGSVLRFTLVADCLQLAHQSGVARPGADPAIASLASAVAVSADQLAAIARFIATCHRVANGETWVGSAVDDLHRELAAIDDTGGSASAAGGISPGALTSRTDAHRGLERLVRLVLGPEKE